VSNVEWLLREALDERTHLFGERTAFDNAGWRATIERIEIGAGLRVFLTDAHAHQDITVEAHSDRTDRWVAGQVTITGRADIDFHDGAHTHAAADQAVLFRLSGRGAAYSLKAGTRFHSAGYGLAVDRIVRLFDGDVPASLRALLEPRVEVSRTVATDINRRMRGLASGLFARGFNGPLRTLMMEGAVLQLLAVQAMAAEDRLQSRLRPALSGHERTAVHDARERLLADMRQPPTLGDLADAVGLTEKRLNAGFRALFGVTVFEALRNERLDHARLAFHSGAVTLKEVSFRVGYNHVTNFINAFTQRYGAPPRQSLVRPPRRRQPA
jgi:AraC-like DNA-binding protein